MRVLANLRVVLDTGDLWVLFLLGAGNLPVLAI